MLKFSLQFCCEREGAQSVSCEPQISRQRGCYRAIMVERLIVYAGLPHVLVIKVRSLPVTKRSRSRLAPVISISASTRR
jgi:hypothetical protein